jgi:hypothetical protein
MHVIFENDGEIDAAAIRTFGVSVKQGDNPIGFFGTGLKYALAILLRTGHSVAIQSGLEKHRFALKDVTIRGETFQVVTMNRRELGFTTQGWQDLGIVDGLPGALLQLQGRRRVGLYRRSAAETSLGQDAHHRRGR